MHKGIIFALAAGAALASSGCAENSAGNGISLSPSMAQSLASIGTFTMADLQNADSIALKAGDSQGSTCYEGIEAFVQEQQASIGGASTNTVSGAFSAFEAARTTVKGANNLVSNAQVKALETACGGLIIDTQNDVVGFLAKIAALGKL